MMVWGGVLYLRNGDVPTVYKLCAARDRMVRDMGENIRRVPFRLVLRDDDVRPAWMLWFALVVYWFVALFRHARPRRESSFDDREMLRSERVRTSLAYQEAWVEPSDARFVQRWIFAHRDARHVPLNHARVAGGRFDAARHVWTLDVDDAIADRKRTVEARCVVNAAGPWTDELNARFGRRSPWKHAFSKGVHLSVARDPRHTSHLMLETRAYPGDIMALLPWGPVSLYGPTETISSSIEEGTRVEPQDVQLLLRELGRQCALPVTPDDVVNLRVGVRSLAVPFDTPDGAAPQTLSRRTIVHADAELPWVSIYGGKLTGCTVAAREAARVVLRAAGRDGNPDRAPEPPALGAPETRYPGLAVPVPDPVHCRDHEDCYRLEDWLRRRTNVAQWVRRGGLGERDEHVPHLLEIARLFTDGDEARARVQVEAWRQRVRREHDDVLGEVRAMAGAEAAQVAAA